MADPKDKLVHENHIYIFTVVMVLVAFRVFSIHKRHFNYSSMVDT